MQPAPQQVIADPVLPPPSRPPQSRRIRRKRRNDRQAHRAYVLSAMFALPLVWMVGTSFKTAQQALTLPVVWWPHPFLRSNYPQLFAALPYLQVLP